MEEGKGEKGERERERSGERERKERRERRRSGSKRKGRERELLLLLESLIATASGELRFLPLHRTKNEKEFCTLAVLAKENSARSTRKEAPKGIANGVTIEQWFCFFFFNGGRGALFWDRNSASWISLFFCASRATHLRDLAVHAAAAITEERMEEKKRRDSDDFPSLVIDDDETK